MEIQGTRFGTLEFDDREIITIRDGLLGFPLSKRFLMFPYGNDSSFFWLQSVDEPEIAFIVVNPFDFFADMEFAVQDEDAESLELERGEDVEVFTLVTIPEGRPEEMRTNLAGPVVVNVQNRLGKQILLREYSPRQPLIPQEMRSKYLNESRERRPGRRSRRRHRSDTLKMAAAG